MKELLNSCSVVLGLGTFTKCKINEVDAIGVDDSERLGTAVRVCTRFGRVVAELEEVTSIWREDFSKYEPFHFCSKAHQNLIERLMYNNRLTSIT